MVEAAGLPARERRRAGGQVPRRHRALPAHVRGPPGTVSLREVRAGRELLGDRLRHAVLHAARLQGHPAPVPPDLFLPARDPARLVGQRRLRRRRPGTGPRGSPPISPTTCCRSSAGEAAEYRQATLQNYRDYVTTGKDFPLAPFRERHSPASEAVGYGRALMLFHVMRRALGDEAFRPVLPASTRSSVFARPASTTLRRALEAASGRDLGTPSRRPWIAHGRAAAGVRDVAAVQAEERWRVRGTLAQVQPGKRLRWRCPWPCRPKGERGGDDGLTSPGVSTRSARPARACGRCAWTSIPPSTLPPARSARTPPALSGSFRRAASLVLLAADSDSGPAGGLPGDGRGLESAAHAPKVVLDTEVQRSRDRSVWLFGRANRFAKDLSTARPLPRRQRVTIDRQAMPLRDHAASSCAATRASTRPSPGSSPTASTPWGPRRASCRTTPSTRIWGSRATSRSTC